MPPKSETFGNANVDFDSKRGCCWIGSFRFQVDTHPQHRNNSHSIRVQSVGTWTRHIGTSDSAHVLGTSAHGLGYTRSFPIHVETSYHTDTLTSNPMPTNATLITHLHHLLEPLNTEPFSPAPPPTGRGSYFTKKYTSLFNIQFTHIQEFMWGLHNTRFLTCNPSPRCPMRGQFTSNGHMAYKCPSMSGLRHDRHDTAL
jgi:hypothetical protein